MTRAHGIAASPSEHVAAIRTPMLVIHGELDHRVPISEGLRLWTDLARHGVEAKFLYFPDENHWVLKPANARLWYETVLAWLDHHVLGLPWVKPDTPVTQRQPIGSRRGPVGGRYHRVPHEADQSMTDDHARDPSPSDAEQYNAALVERRGPDRCPGRVLGPHRRSDPSTSSPAST